MVALPRIAFAGGQDDPIESDHAWAAAFFHQRGGQLRIAAAIASHGSFVNDFSEAVDVGLWAAGAFGGNVDEMIKKRDAMCPTGKQGEPWDVAYLALYLASDEAKYMTGTALVLDGGITCLVK